MPPKRHKQLPAAEKPQRSYNALLELRFSERVLKRRVEEIAGLVRSRVVDESAGEKIAVARVTLQVPREVIGGEEIGFRAEYRAVVPVPARSTAEDLL